jgi:hypothetical protein
MIFHRISILLISSNNNCFNAHCMKTFSQYMFLKIEILLNVLLPNSHIFKISGRSTHELYIVTRPRLLDRFRKHDATFKTSHVKMTYAPHIHFRVLICDGMLIFFEANFCFLVTCSFLYCFQSFVKICARKGYIL